LFLFFGLVGLGLKSYRVIFIIIFLEMSMVGVVIFLLIVPELVFFLLLTFCLISGVFGVLILTIMITSYGEEYVKF
jgi:hypothetical protein